MKYIGFFTSVLIVTLMECSCDGKADNPKLNKADTLKINMWLKVSDSFRLLNQLDSSGEYARKAINLSKEIKWKYGEAKGIFACREYTYFVEKDYVKTLSDCLYTLPVFENNRDTFHIFENYRALARIYFFLNDFPTCIVYCKKLLEHAIKTKNHEMTWFANGAIAESYCLLGKADSCRFYSEQALVLTNFFKPADSNYTKGETFIGLASSAYLNGDDDLTILYLKKAWPYAQRILVDNSSMRTKIHSQYFMIFMDLNQWDSALNRLRLSSATAPYEHSGMFDYTGNIDYAKVFEHINKDSSIKYYKAANEVRNDFDNRMKSEIARLTEKEAQRQIDMQNQQEAEQRSRIRNIQFSAIAVALGTLIIVFLVYSRSIIANSKLMSFLGILMLLIVFEFINLLIHPYIAHATGESPLLMLVIMVFIASLLVPAHHRIQHWVSNQLVEKNKKIKIAAAKKIIATLGNDAQT